MREEEIYRRFAIIQPCKKSKIQRSGCRLRHFPRSSPIFIINILQFKRGWTGSSNSIFWRQVPRLAAADIRRSVGRTSIRWTEAFLSFLTISRTYLVRLWISKPVISKSSSMLGNRRGTKNCWVCDLWRKIIKRSSEPDSVEHGSVNAGRTGTVNTRSKISEAPIMRLFHMKSTLDSNSPKSWSDIRKLCTIDDAATSSSLIFCHKLRQNVMASFWLPVGGMTVQFSIKSTHRNHTVSVVSLSERFFHSSFWKILQISFCYICHDLKNATIFCLLAKSANRMNWSWSDLSHVLASIFIIMPVFLGVSYQRSHRYLTCFYH